MTENEAIEELKLIKHTRIFIPSDEVWEMAIQALEEIQQYRAIGTMDEFKDLKENEPKCNDCAGCTNWKCDCANERAKAIDELKNEICTHFADWKYSEDEKCIKDLIELASESVEEIAEQLKAGGTE